MTESVSTNVDEVTGKYEATGWISRRLVSQFFSAVYELIPSNIDSCLEVSCGAGYSSERLRPTLAGVRFEASDVDPELVELARRRNSGLPVTCESIYELERDTDSFNLVFALEVLEHLEDPHAALTELKRVTAKHVILSVPREPIWRMLNMARGSYLRHCGNTPGHLNHWSTRKFVALVGEYFTVRAVKTPIPWTIVHAELPQ